MSDFSDWVMATAKQRGIDSHAGLARKLGIAQSTVNRWVFHDAVPRRDAVRKLSEELGVPVARILIEAGYIRPDELTDRFDAVTLTDAELVAEVARRLSVQSPALPTSDQGEGFGDAPPPLALADAARREVTEAKARENRRSQDEGR